MDYLKESLRLHELWQGKMEITPRAPAGNRDELSLAYTPGVAQPCLEIQKDIDKSYTLTRRHNLCLVVTDGSAVLGLGNIGPEAGMPVMEGKCVLFKAFGGVDAFPLCVKSQDVDEFVQAVYLISGSFGGINLEDISAPRCFEIEDKLKARCDIPVFHDDQHGTAVVVLAALSNALKVVGKDKKQIRVAMSGAGAAGCAIARLLLDWGVEDIAMCDKYGVIYKGRPENDQYLARMAQRTNRRSVRGGLRDILPGADVFIGVSAPHLLNKEDISLMNKDAIVFAMANPVPEIEPEEASAGGAAVIATGRSDHPNQVNNVLAFPGIFRGAFDVRAREINETMKLAAAQALASMVPESELSADRILPRPFDPGVGEAVARAVAQAARDSGVARI
ncbi:MAG: NADP-dependent malic enzyme [Firmicutes bacterium]|nr:NADP-dependent malic enzyme [Bacillota bacterium]